MLLIYSLGLYDSKDLLQLASQMCIIGNQYNIYLLYDVHRYINSLLIKRMVSTFSTKVSFFGIVYCAASLWTLQQWVLMVPIWVVSHFGYLSRWLLL